MAGPLIFIEVTEKPPIEARMREHPEAMRTAFEAGGVLWAQDILPRHFEEGSARRYGHQPRKERTKKRKLAAARVGAAILGGRVDNVFTGLMMRAVLGAQRIKARPGGVEILIFGPRYLFQYDKRRGHPQKAREISTVIAEEEREVAAELDKVYHARQAEIDDKKTTRFGGQA